MKIVYCLNSIRYLGGIQRVTIVKANALRRLQPDIVVSAGQSEKYMLTSIPGNWVKIRELHFLTTYRKIQAHTFKEKVSAACSDFYDYAYKIKQYDKIVVLTQEDSNGWIYSMNY